MRADPIFWVSTHRVHHQLSDKEGDPHTPREGGWWAHAGWILFGEALHSQIKALSRYSPDLSRDRFHVWLSKYHWMPITLSAILLFSLGWYWGGFVNGVAMFLWGALLRVTLGLHATWLVNSATHMWGSRRFETRDDSRNNWWVALLTGGEGWHNNHHAHPVSARHGLKWYEIDPNFWGIWILEKLGLARKVQVAKFDPKNPKPAGMRIALPIRRQIYTELRKDAAFPDREGRLFLLGSKRFYRRAFALTHSTRNSGSATTSTSTPAGNPT